MTATARRAPWITWAYGLAGLIPFFAGALGAAARLPPGDGWWREALAVYAALILSFLGGARWGLELPRTPVRKLVIGLSMAPSITAYLLLLLPASSCIRWTLAGLAGAHLLQGLWDVRSADPPSWYSPLRLVLTTGAVLSLLAGLASR